MVSRVVDTCRASVSRRLLVVSRAENQWIPLMREAFAHKKKPVLVPAGEVRPLRL